MTENSRSQVTITLGRSGQVVKKAGPVLEGAFSHSHPSVGSKRSIRDRLGTNVDSVQLDYKRQRGDDNRLSTRLTDCEDDLHLDKDDLRYKIMRKSRHKKTESEGQQNGVDLREMLSRPARSSSSLGTQQLMPGPKNDRQHNPDKNEVRQSMPEMRDGSRRMPEMRDGSRRMPEMRDGSRRMPEMRDNRQRMPELRDVSHRMPETNGADQRMSEMRDVRRRMPETRDVRQHIPVARDTRQRMHESTSVALLKRIPPTRNVDSLPQMDSVRNSYSPWTLDHLRRRSPDGVLGTSRGASPPRSVEESRKRASVRDYDHDDVRTVKYLSKDGLELSRPMGTASYMAKSALAAGPAKPVAPLLAPPPGVIVQKSSYTVDERPTVEGLLHSLGLGKYVINFKAEEVDMAALRQMGDNDLKQLGIPMGPRKKILLALLPRSRRQV